MCSSPLTKHPQCSGWPSREGQGWPLQLHKAGLPCHRLSHIHLLLTWWAAHSQPAVPNSTIGVLTFFLYFFIPFHADVFPLEYTSYFWSYLNSPTSASKFVFLISIQTFSHLFQTCLCGGYAAVLHQSWVFSPNTWSERPWVARESLQLGLQGGGWLKTTMINSWTHQYKFLSS